MCTVKIGYDLSNDNYIFAAFLVIAALICVVFTSTKIALLLLLFLGFVGHQIIQFGAPEKLIYLWDVIVVLLFFKTLLVRLSTDNKIKIIGFLPVVGVIAVIVTSTYLNNVGFLQTTLFARYLIFGYLILFSVLNLKMNEKDTKAILRFIIFLFIVQIPASIIKFVILGQGEQSVGTFGFSPGELGTLLPLIAISFLFALILYNPSKRRLYISLIFVFIGFSLIAEKRAFFFLLPIVLMVIFIFYRGNSRVRRRFMVLLIPILLIVGYGFPRLNPCLNPQTKIGGDFDPYHIYNFFKSYVNLHDPEGRSQGRWATTKMTINNLRISPQIFLIGDGPGKLINSGILDADINVSKFNYNIEDGITGFAWTSLQIGMLGFIFYILFLLVLIHAIWKKYKSTSNKFLRIMGLGLLGTSFVFLFDILIYSRAFMSGRNLSLVFFILSAIYLKCGEQFANNSILKLSRRFD